MRIRYLLVLFLLILASDHPMTFGQERPRSGAVPEVRLSITPSSNLVTYGESTDLTICIENKSYSVIYLANWSQSPIFYEQNNGEITISYVPFYNEFPKAGKGWGATSPGAFYPMFLTLKPGRKIEWVLRIPPKSTQDWRLEKGRWKISLRHLWVARIPDFRKLYGQELLDILKAKGNIVNAIAEIEIR